MKIKLQSIWSKVQSGSQYMMGMAEQCALNF